MTPDEAVVFVEEMYAKRPGKDLVQFRRFDIGSVIEPWSTEPGPYRSEYPSPELWNNAMQLKTLGRNIPNDCRLVFGLGSIYMLVACASDEVLYLGRAGSAPAQSRIPDHLELPDVGPTLTFPRHRWRDKQCPEAEVIRAGNFYVVLILNVAPYGKFENPFHQPSGIVPYEEISKDLESWVMRRGGKPPLNTTYEGNRPINWDGPWGTPCL